MNCTGNNDKTLYDTCSKDMNMNMPTHRQVMERVNWQMRSA